MFSLLDALHCLCKAWDSVKSETIKGCFRKAGFIEKAVEENREHRNENEELIDCWQQLEYGNQALLNDFIECDAELATSGILSLEEIAHECSLDNVML